MLIKLATGSVKKESILESHKSEIQKLVQDSKDVQEVLKDEYVSAIKKLKELRQIEQDSVIEMTSSASKLSEITNKVDLNSKAMTDIQSRVDERSSEEIRRKEGSLEQKERDLAALQEDLERVKRRNEEEHSKKTESLAKLENELRIREAEQTSERKYFEKAKSEFQEWSLPFAVVPGRARHRALPLAPLVLEDRHV